MKKLLLLISLAACNQTTINTPIRSFDRPSDVALFCTQYDPAENQRVWNSLPIEMCSADAVADTNNWRCANSTGNPGETPQNNCIDFFGNQDVIYKPHMAAVVANSARGELAGVDIDNGIIIDLDPVVPGYQFLPVGALPEHVRTTHDGCRAATANVDSCDVSVVDLTKFINAPSFPFRVLDAGITDGGPPIQPPPDYVASMRQTVKLTAGGQPLFAKPGWIEIAPESKDGVAAQAQCNGGSYWAWVSLPACEAVVEVPLVDVMSGTVLTKAGTVVRALNVTQTGTREIDPNSLTCPIECANIPGTQNGYPVDLGADASTMTFDAGAGNPPPRVPTTQAFPGSIAIDVENGVGRMFIADRVSRRVSIVPIDPVSGAPSPARAINLAEQPIGVDVVRVSPRSEAGKFLYAVARDASVRVIDLDREVECETNPDPNDATLRQVPPTVTVPSGSGPVPGDDPQPQARHFGCFPLGDPATPARSPLSTGPGITMPANALPRDVAFVHLDLSPPPTNTVTTPPSAGPRVFVGDFAWIVSSDGRGMAVNIYDACPAPNIPQQIGSGFSSVCDPSNVVPSRNQALLEPSGPEPFFYDRVSHRPRRGTDRFSPPLNCSDPSSGAARLAAEDAPLNANFSTGNGASTQITLGADGGTSSDDGGVVDAGVPTDDGGVGQDGGAASQFSIPNFDTKALPPPSVMPTSGQGCPTPQKRSVGFTNPFDTKNDNWTLDWEGVIPTTQRSSGVVGKSDATLFIDSGGAWCTRGAKSGDKLDLTGCNQDSDCDINQTCQKSATAPADVTTGLCLPGTAIGGQALIDARKLECAPLLNAKLRYRITSAKQGTQLPFGNVGAMQVTDALKLAEIYEPEYSFQTLDCSTDDKLCSQVTVRRTQADGTTVQLPTSCVSTLDEHGQSVKRCVRTCEDGLSCGQDFQCQPSRYGDMRCMYAPLSEQLFTDCVPEVQPYLIRAGDSFLVTGQASGQLSDLEPSPVDRECSLPVNATAPFVKLRQARLPIDPKTMDPCTDPVTADKPYLALPSSFSRNVCTISDDATQTVVHFENPWFAFGLIVPKIQNGASAIIIPPPSLQLTFQVVGGQGPLAISLASDVQAQQPRVAITGPDRQTVYIIDEGKQSTGTGLRGQLLRLVSGAQSVDRTFQVR